MEEAGDSVSPTGELTTTVWGTEGRAAAFKEHIVTECCDESQVYSSWNRGG